MKEGASNFFAKPFQGSAFMAAVGHALEENGIARRKAREKSDLLARYCSLTPREQEVLPLLVSGLMNKQAAAHLGITEYTVQVHRGHIMRKMRADSFASLVRMAERLSPHGLDETTRPSVERSAWGLLREPPANQSGRRLRSRRG
jgi:FixJ family two-component response regulator